MNFSFRKEYMLQKKNKNYLKKKNKDLLKDAVLKSG